METKRCSKCGKIKPISEFYKDKNRKSGYQYQCKECIKQWQEDNKEYIKQYSKQYYEDNKEHRKQYGKQWREKNKEHRKQLRKQYRENNKEKIRQYEKQYHNNIHVKLSRRISTAIWRSLKSGKNGRHWETLVGFTLKDLIKHLESQFQKGMSWDNYGKWEIDHKTPISWFKFISCKEKKFKECWALSNLQPLWAEENLRKSNRYTD